MKKTNLILTFLISSVSLAGCSALNNVLDNIINSLNSGTNQTTITDSQYLPTATSNYQGNYYDGIDSNQSGDTLKNALRSLNSSKISRLVGYSGMGTNKYGYFRYTDYDPETVQYDSNGMPYGTKLVGYYTLKSSQGKISNNVNEGELNREHVWPKSHGGNLMEEDIHMPRPAFTDDNGARGNDFYGTAAFDSGYEVPNYRGDAARIIFYCAMANSTLQMSDLTNHGSTNANPDYMMGKLSDLLTWNLQYAPTDREERRNNGAQYLQGNRNPFIDHPEYACKIWGGYNSDTKRICGM